MPEATQYLYSHKELVTLLIKQQGIHEGTWQLLVSFGFAASNVGGSPAGVNPAAIVQVAGIGIQRTAGEKTNLCVDAAEVNPA